MIIVFKFASGSCDGTNVWGHAAVVFNGLAHKKCFAISQMKNDGTDPTWHNSTKILKGARSPGRQTHSWRRLFFESRVGHSFPRVMDKAHIISHEDLLRLNLDPPLSGGLSEEHAFQWWRGVIQSTPNMSQALGGKDCADTVVAALQASQVNPGQYPARALSRPVMTPQAVVDYARAINAQIVRETGVTDEQVNDLLLRDKIWNEGYLPVGGIFVNEDDPLLN